MQNKTWVIKMGSALIVSNLFFFLLFSGNKQDETIPPSLTTPSGWVEVQLAAELLTTLKEGKQVLLVNRFGKVQIEGILIGPSLLSPEKFIIQVKEHEASKLFEHNSWEILPFIKNMSFRISKSGVQHEIRY